jgi:hypothetical protein
MATTLLSALRGISETERSLMTGFCAFWGLLVSAGGFAAAFTVAGTAGPALSGVAEGLLPADGVGAFA